MPFRALHLSPQILQAVRDSGYTEPTPIQIAAIPLILAGHDVIGIAQTGVEAFWVKDEVRETA